MQRCNIGNKSIAIKYCNNIFIVLCIGNTKEKDVSVSSSATEVIVKDTVRRKNGEKGKEGVPLDKSGPVTSKQAIMDEAGWGMGW